VSDDDHDSFFRSVTEFLKQIKANLGTFKQQDFKSFVEKASEAENEISEVSLLCNALN